MIDNSAAQTYLFGRVEYDAADLYTIGIAGGPLILTTWDEPLLSGTPAVIQRGPFRMTMGTDIGSVDITVTGASFGGLSLSGCALRGDFDKATFVVERVLDPGGDNIRVPRFSGYVDSVEPNTSSLRVVARDIKSLLDLQIPGRTYQPNCPYKYKSTPCGATSANTSCAKTPAACTANANFARFGGFPYIVQVIK